MYNAETVSEFLDRCFDIGMLGNADKDDPAADGRMTSLSGNKGTVFVKRAT